MQGQGWGQTPVAVSQKLEHILTNNSIKTMEDTDEYRVEWLKDFF